MLREFFCHCSECLILQKRKHLLYRSLQPISSPPILFYTLTLDLILALPVALNSEFNAVMSVTCKYTKNVTLVPGKDTWSVKKWARTLLSRLELIDWGLPAVLITNQYPKILSGYLTTLFKKLGVGVFYSTAYHTQTDRSSKRTNQTVKIALRFLLHTTAKPRK